jgi:type IV secretion system protein TrbL
MRSASVLRPIHLLLLGALIAFLVTHPAHADGLLDQIGTSYRQATGNWQSKLFDIAKSLFVKLALLELLWSGIWWVINRDEPDRLMSNLIKKVMGLMFFWAILLNFATWIPAIINGFSKAGQTAAGIGALTPSDVLDTGLQLSTGILNKISLNILSSDGLLTALTGAFAGILILIAFTVIAGQMLVTLIESYIAISAGVLFLGFAGSRWTTSFAEKYISYTVSVGVKLFITYLIIGVGQSLASQWTTLIVTGMKAKDYLPIVGSSIVYMFLCWQIPSLASSMLSGAVSMTLGGAAATAASVGAAGAGAVGMAAASVAGGVGAAKGIAGGAAGLAQLAGAAGGAAAAGGASGPMSMVSGAMGAVGGAIGGAVTDGIKGLGGNSTAGKLASRVSAGSAAATDNRAMSAAGNVAAPSASNAGSTAGGAASGGAPSVPVPSSSQSPIIDTSTSVSQAVQQRDAGTAARQQPGGPGSGGASASGSPATAGAGGAETSAADGAGSSATYPTSSPPPTPNSNQQPKAPPKSTLERMSNSAKALSQTPNDSAGGQGIQIDMKHHKD